MPNVRPIVDEGLGNSSYLVEAAEGRALVVDPSRDPRPYLRAAAAWDLEIAWVAETLKGARSRIPSRGRLVLVDEPAQHVAAAQPDAGPLTSRIVMWLWSFEAEPAM